MSKATQVHEQGADLSRSEAIADLKPWPENGLLVRKGCSGRGLVGWTCPRFMLTTPDCGARSIDVVLGNRFALVVSQCQLPSSKKGALSGWSDVFLSLVVKHDSWARTSAAKVNYVERLKTLSAGLPPREIDVCDGILQGISSEGMALRLNVSVNTVRNLPKASLCPAEHLLAE
jgi:hypothetical protein